MSLWYVSFFTGIVSIIAMYYSMRLKEFRLKTPSLIAFSLLLMGETIDLLADIALSTALLFFAEMLEMFITVGFFSLIYYIHIKKEDNNKKRKKKK
jgi:hypothetical protein